MAKFCAKCGKELKPAEKFCMSCGAPVQNARGGNIRNEAVRKSNVGKMRDSNTYQAYREVSNKRKARSNSAVKARKRADMKISKYIVALAVILICLVFIMKVCFPSKKALIGNWVVRGTPNQILQIRTEELRFDGRTFDYTVDGHTLLIKQTNPESLFKGEIPFKLRGDTLTIEIGTELSGFFYGRRGEATLDKYDTW